MLYFVLGILVGLLVALVVQIVERRHDYKFTDHVGDELERHLPRKRGVLIKTHNIPGEWHKDIPTGESYDVSRDTQAS